VTVRDWIERHLPAPPPALAAQLLSALGSDADADESTTAERCLAAAARLLDGLLAEHRFGRESALDLLTVDALTTYAFEHASHAGASRDELEAFARRAAQALGQLTSQRA
jgi:hypothetical protein